MELQGQSFCQGLKQQEQYWLVDYIPKSSLVTFVSGTWGRQTQAIC
jgi:hypothetical protein